MVVTILKRPSFESESWKPEPLNSTYIFKSASEMPPIKSDYVVKSPTPLGQRTEPAKKEGKGGRE